MNEASAGFMFATSSKHSCDTGDRLGLGDGVRLEDGDKLLACELEEEAPGPEFTTATAEQTLRYLVGLVAERKEVVPLTPLKPAGSTAQTKDFTGV